MTSPVSSTSDGIGKRYMLKTDPSSSGGAVVTGTRACVRWHGTYGWRLEFRGSKRKLVFQFHFLNRPCTLLLSWWQEWPLVREGMISINKIFRVGRRLQSVWILHNEREWAKHRAQDGSLSFQLPGSRHLTECQSFPGWESLMWVGRKK